MFNIIETYESDCHNSCWQIYVSMYHISRVIVPDHILMWSSAQWVVWYKYSWLGFLKILNYVPKEREKYTAKNKPSFATVKFCDGSVMT